MHDEILSHETMRELAKKISATGHLEKAQAVFGYGLEGEVLASALCFLYKKPSLGREIIDRNEIKIFPEEIALLVVAHSIDNPEALFGIIRQFRKKGIKIEEIVATKKPAPEIEDELRVLGIDLVVV